MKSNSLMLRAGLPVVILGLAIAIAFVMISTRKPPAQKDQGPRTLLVDVLPVKMSDVTFQVRAQGSVQPKVVTDLVSEVQGRVVEISPAFINGGFFNQGDLLIRIEQADYLTAVKAAEAEVARAIANLEEEKARGKVAEQDWKNFNPDDAPGLGLRKPQLAKELANVSFAEADLERARRDLERTEIRAPYDGMVRSKDVDLGQYVVVGTNLGMIYGTNEAEVRLPVSDNDLAYLEMPLYINGDKDRFVPPKVTLTSRIAGEEVSWSARLVRSEGVIDEKSRLAYLVAQVDDPYRRKQGAEQPLPLKFGRFVDARIEGQRAENIVKLPRYVLRTDNRMLLVDEDNVLRLRPVTVLHQDADHVYVGDGLLPGERIALTSISNPLDGMLVRVKGDATAPDSELELASEQTQE